MVPLRRIGLEVSASHVCASTLGLTMLQRVRWTCVCHHTLPGPWLDHVPQREDPGSEDADGTIRSP